MTQTLIPQIDIIQERRAIASGIKVRINQTGRTVTLNDLKFGDSVSTKGSKEDGKNFFFAGATAEQFYTFVVQIDPKRYIFYNLHFREIGGDSEGNLMFSEPPAICAYDKERSHVVEGVCSNHGPEEYLDYRIARAAVEIGQGRRKL
jgi:hypothetical protein